MGGGIKLLILPTNEALLLILPTNEALLLILPTNEALLLIFLIVLIFNIALRFNSLVRHTWQRRKGKPRASWSWKTWAATFGCAIIAVTFPYTKPLKPDLLVQYLILVALFPANSKNKQNFFSNKKKYFLKKIAIPTRSRCVLYIFWFFKQKKFKLWRKFILKILKKGFHKFL